MYLHIWAWLCLAFVIGYIFENLKTCKDTKLLFIIKIYLFYYQVEPALVVWSIILCLLGRAANIFPLALLVNRFREHQITRKMMFIMWFSGLRGAVSYALSLHLDFSDETRHVIITTTLIIVLFTTLILGGSTMPLLKFLRAEKKQESGNSRRRKREKGVSLSKTREWVSS